LIRTAQIMSTDHGPIHTGGSAELSSCIAASTPLDGPEVLDTRYLSDRAAFWRNVQEPSTRVKDAALLARLAVRALDRFDDRFVQAAALVNLLYRTTEPGWTDVIAAEALFEKARVAVLALRPSESFSDCRWFLSASLAICAFHLHRGEKDQACAVLGSPHALLPVALAHGQLFTNVAKSALLRLAVAATLPIELGQQDTLRAVADEILAHSSDLARNYKFSNEFAYEEVAYVYTMLREIYNWRRLVRPGVDDLASLELAGFRWRRVGGPFNALLKT
jgi:hypothetical protein